MKIIGSILFIAITLTFAALMFFYAFAFEAYPEFTLGTNVMLVLMLVTCAIVNLASAIGILLPMIHDAIESKHERKYYCIGCGKKINLEKRNYAGVRNGQQCFTCMTCVDKKMKAHSKSIHDRDTKKMETECNHDKSITMKKNPKLWESLERWEKEPERIEDTS